MRNKHYFLLLLFSLLAFKGLLATHIVGGFISYRYLSGTTYEVKLTIYRDCNSQTPFDGTPGATTDAIVGLFQGTNGPLEQVYAFTNPVITQILPPTDNPCLQTSSNVCVEQGVYTLNITLPSATQSYTLVHERCCRNGTITNVFNPGDQGAVYSAYIPPTTPFQNTSPTFNSLPPLFICVNAPLIIDYSATDADGDQLTYTLCTPSNGGTVSDPAPNPPLGPPYNSIPWETGYTVNNLLGGTPPLAVDPVTGVLTGTPNTVGQFVIGVCVTESRNGQVISTYLRDYQVNVTQCNTPVANIPSVDINPNTGIGTYITNCNSGFVQFQNNTYNPPPTNIPLNYEWDFGDPTTTTDVSTQALPTYTYPDTGTYLVKLIVVKGTGANLCSDTTFAFVKIYPNGTAAFNATTACPGVAVQFTDNSTTPVGNITEWDWNFADGSTSTTQNPTHVFTTEGVYNVTLISTSSVGCKDTVTNPVLITSGVNSDFSFTTPCVNQQVDFSLIDNQNVSSSVWTMPNGSNPTGTVTSYTFTTGGTYPVTLVVSSNEGCFDTTTRQVTVQVPVTALTDSAENSCAGTPVQLNASGGLYYRWFPEDGLNDPFSASPVAQVDSNTFYTVIVSNDCFADTAVVPVFVRPIPTVNAGNDTTIWRDTYVVLNGTTDGVTYFWNPSTWIDEPFSLTTKAQPRETTWYELFAQNVFGCSAKDSVLVTVIYNNIADIPTAFTPNADGVNDVFRIVRWLNVSALKELAVYNRWGQKIFTTSNIEQGWDGTHNGKPCELGVYVWHAALLTGDGKDLLLKGNVTLLR